MVFAYSALFMDLSVKNKYIQHTVCVFTVCSFQFSYNFLCAVTVKHPLWNYGKGRLILCGFVLYTSGVFESAQPSKHVDNVGGFITDGSCMCCQLCVSQLYQNKKLGPQLQRAVTA